MCLVAQLSVPNSVGIDWKLKLSSVPGLTPFARIVSWMLSDPIDVRHKGGVKVLL